MPYVRRNASGQIDSLHRSEESGTVFVSEGDPELLAFIGDSGAEFGRLDADFVRVIEDVIDTLIVKNVLNVTDLPHSAQVKLFARKSFRERVSQSSLRLFEPTDFNDMI
jgi:hypothetical protein